MTGSIREAKPADRPALLAIQTTTLAEPWPELLALAVDGPPILLVADAAAPAEGGDASAPASSREEETFAGETAGASEPVGYALAVTDGDDAVGYLVELAVAPDRRGDGRGSDLLEALVERLRRRGVDRLRVTVRVVDDRAQSFYRDRGFDEREKLPDHYESGDGVLLVRTLD